MEHEDILETSESYDQIKAFMKGAGQNSSLRTGEGRQESAGFA